MNKRHFDMAHEKDWSLDFNNRDMDDDVVSVDFNLISHLQQQLQLHTKVAVMMIICIITYGLNMLCCQVVQQTLLGSLYKSVINRS